MTIYGVRYLPGYRIDFVVFIKKGGVMVTASIIAVGSELMRGKMDDTNSTFLARWFEANGIKVVNRVNAADTNESLISAFKNCKGTDIVVTTGGLGPTDDDITRDVFAEFISKKLVFSESTWSEIAEYIVSKKFILSDSNKRQAFVPETAEIIRNPNGTAPALYCLNGGVHYFLLPGPPSENKPLITNDVYSILNKVGLLKGKIWSSVYRVYETGESALADMFDNKDSGYFDEIGYYFSQSGFVELHFRKYSESGRPEGFDKEVDFFLDILNKNKVFYTENKPLPFIVYDLLLEKGLKVTFAESCTGGNISGNFVSCPGVSAVYNGGIVAYSNDIKNKILGVDQAVLDGVGAVSKECVEAMSNGVLKMFNADIAVAVSGIAGPDGGTVLKPVGLVWFSINYKGKIFSESEVFVGDRDRVINRSVNRVYRRLIEVLNKNIC